MPRSAGNGTGGAVAGQSRLSCIPAGISRENPGLLLGSARFRDFLARQAEEHDVVVLDSGPVLALADTLELLPLVDGVIVCVRAGVTTRDQVQALSKVIAPFSGPSTGVVMTGLRAGEPIHTT